ncbi:MAG TPA: SAM-dependent chlorinase/fluorinase, partial [Leptolinea sp.]
MLLGRCTPYFPENSIHLAVVDPGVGTQRRGLAARLGDQFFVGPDNGLCTLIVQQAVNKNLPVSFFSIDNPDYWLPVVTQIFHGRDVFAPVAAHLAAGLPLEKVGSPIENPILLTIPVPLQIKHGWRGTILHVDHFGNLTSNLTIDHLQPGKTIEITIQAARIEKITSTYGSAYPGELIALLDDSNSLEIAVSQGSAANMLHAGIGTKFDLVFQE